VLASNPAIAAPATVTLTGDVPALVKCSKAKPATLSHAATTGGLSSCRFCCHDPTL
jgi:hypothetical protein